MLDFLGGFVSFGISGADSQLSCAGFRGYRSSLIVFTVVPTIVAGSICVVGVGRWMHDRSSKRDIDPDELKVLLKWEVHSLLQVAFIAYPLVTTKAFEAFSCYDFTGSSWLKADVAIQCHTEEHDRIQTLAWLAIGIYPVG